MNTDYKHKELTKNIIKHFYEIYNEPGYGFLESVYERSLSIVLTKCGLQIETQAPKSQILNYLKSTQYEVGLLLNCGSTPQIKRFIFDNERKICKRSTQNKPNELNMSKSE